MVFIESMQVACNCGTGVTCCPQCYVTYAARKEKLILYISKGVFTENGCSHHCSDNWKKKEMISE